MVANFLFSNLNHNNNNNANNMSTNQYDRLSSSSNSPRPSTGSDPGDQSQQSNLSTLSTSGYYSSSASSISSSPTLSNRFSSAVTLTKYNPRRSSIDYDYDSTDDVYNNSYNGSGLLYSFKVGFPQTPCLTHMNPVF